MLATAASKPRTFEEHLAAIPHEVTFSINGRDVTRTIPEEDRLAQARLNIAEEGDIERLVADLITLNSEGGATQERLNEMGWSNAALYLYLDKAKARANKLFLRDIDAEPHRSLTAIQNDMADVISSLLPPTNVLVAELQARGFSPKHIDLMLQKARAKAALAFCHGQTGWAN